MTSPQPSAKTLHTCPLTPAQATALQALLRASGWKFEPRPYTLYFAQKDKLTVAVYEKGPKLVIQGKGTQEFLQNYLAPEFLGHPAEAETSDPAFFTPHLGIDESGKGDFFGPLVIAGAYVNPTIARHYIDSGIRDSKCIHSDRRIRELAEMIRSTPGAVTDVVCIGPERYNEIYAKFGNLNRLLAWGHARVIENLLTLQPDCPRALSDQFANPKLIQRALLERGLGITLEQRTKAESDPAVAAASILAREAFINWMQKQSQALQCELPRGASTAVKNTALALVKSCGAKILLQTAKTHFKTAAEVAPEHFSNAASPGKRTLV
jgi:ribonuclease HIII